MSLSQDPVFSELKNNFICGTKDIEDEPYCGVSGRHAPDGKGIVTTNGAGPHNLQLFILAPDGTVLHCLPGFWSPQDLKRELLLGQQLLKVWQDPHLSQGQKNQMFKQMQLAHINEHPADMVKRSRMQGFDQKFEARNRPYKSDTVLNPTLAVQAVQSNDNRLLNQAFKTTDVIMHERMAQRPFEKYQRFDVAVYTDYGRQKYEKHEDDRDMNGKIANAPSKDNNMKRQKNRGVQVFAANGRRIRRMMMTSAGQ